MADLITVQEVGDRIGHDLSSDDGAATAVAQACDIVKTLAEHPILEGTDTILLDGTGSDCLVLPQPPVKKVSTVTVGDEADTDWVLDTRQGMLFKQSGVWTRGRRNVSVKYTHGWATTDIPDAVKAVALALASRAIVQGVAMAEVNGDESIRYAVSSTDLTYGERAILRKVGTRP